MNNLIADISHADIAAEMRTRLKEWQQQSGDPLFTEGDVPLPPTALCDSRDATEYGVELLPEGIR
jgi:hypothetical protein